MKKIDREELIEALAFAVDTIVGNSTADAQKCVEALLSHASMLAHGATVLPPRNPFLTVDAIIQMDNRIVLVKRKNEPHGWALPGGFVEYGESVETAVKREAREEVSLDIQLIRQFGVYSDPNRDPRFHAASVVFHARATGIPVAADDAVEVGIFTLNNLPSPLCFDHGKILEDFCDLIKNGVEGQY